MQSVYKRKLPDLIKYHSYKLSITLTCCEMIQRYPITIKKTQMIRILKLRKEFCLTVKVKHRQLHLLKTKFNFYWSNNLKTNNFAGKLNTKTSIQLNSRSKRNYLSNFSSSFVSNELKVITNLETQREAGWRKMETGTAKLMAAKRKFLLYINTLSEQT